MYVAFKDFEIDCIIIIFGTNIFTSSWMFDKLDINRYFQNTYVPSTRKIKCMYINIYTIIILGFKKIYL